MDSKQTHTRESALSEEHPPFKMARRVPTVGSNDDKDNDDDDDNNDEEPAIRSDHHNLCFSDFLTI